MATAMKPVAKAGVEEAEAAPIHRIRITLTSKNVRNLEKGARWSWGRRQAAVMPALRPLKSAEAPLLTTAARPSSPLSQSAPT